MQVDQENINDWAAYKREKQREASERMEIMIVSIAFAVFACFVVASFYMRATRDEAENADLVEMLEGGSK